MRRFILSITISILTLSVHSQEELTLHFSRIAQSQATNPAIFAEKVVVIGLPSLSFGFANNFLSYRNLIQPVPGTDSIEIDIDRTISRMDDRNFLRTEASVDIFRLNITQKHWYLGLFVSDKVRSSFDFSRGLAELAWYGNGPFIGETIELNPSVQAIYFREYSLSGGIRQEKWQAGARFKFLTGLANIGMPRSQMALTTASSDYALNMDADYRLQTAGFESFAEDPLSALLSTDNRGFGLDIGGIFRPTKAFTLQASLTNLGYIQWSDGIRNAEINGNYTFEGIPLDELLENDSQYFEALIDTLTDIFAPREDNQNYRTELTPRTYFSFTWNPDKKHRLGALVFGRWNEGFKPSLAFYGSRRILKWWDLGASLIVREQNDIDLGLQSNLNLGPFQFYFVTDHVLSAIQWEEAKSLNFRFGMNLAFKKKKEKNTEKKNSK